MSKLTNISIYNSIESALTKIKPATYSLTTVQSSSHEVDTIADITSREFIKLLSMNSQSISEELRHEAYNIVIAMMGRSDVINVFGARPGWGKSTLIRAFLHTILRPQFKHIGVTVALPRVQQARELEAYLRSVSRGSYQRVKTINRFDCAKGYTDWHRRICNGCELKNTCDIHTQNKRLQFGQVLIMTHDKLQRNFEVDHKIKPLISYTHVDEYEELTTDRIIIIDEKPELHIQKIHTIKWLESITDEAIRTNVYEAARPLIQAIRESIEHVCDKRKTHHIASQTVEVNPVVYTKFNQNCREEFIGALEVLKGCTDYGFTYQWNNLNDTRQFSMTIPTVHYWRKYRTCIFDGTAAHDIEYRNHTDFRVFDVGDFRDFSNVHFHINRDWNLSKSGMQKIDIGKLESVVHEIANKCGKTFVITFDEYDRKLLGSLKDLREAEAIIVDHFNNVIGENRFSECEAILLLGNLNMSDSVYLSNCSTLVKPPTNVDIIKPENVRRFADPDIEAVRISNRVVALIQDIMRTQVRNTSNTRPIRVFMFTRDDILLNELQRYFVNCKQGHWAPDTVLEDKGADMLSSFVQTLLVKFLIDESLSTNGEKHMIPKKDIALKLKISDKQLRGQWDTYRVNQVTRTHNIDVGHRHVTFNPH